MKHRVDDAHLACQAPEHIASLAQSGDQAPQNEPLFHEHTRDLVCLLQEWSNDLDRREAQINARTAILEHHERKLRLETQSTCVAQNEQDRSLERRRKELQDEIRRLAVGNVKLTQS